MKILRIIARLNVGGPARHVVWLTKALSSDGFESRLLAGSVPAGEEDMGYLAAEHRISPVYIAEMSRELSPADVVSLFKIYREMLRLRPHIVHTHTAKAGTVGRTAAFLYRWLTWRTLIGRPRKVKVVHTFHGHVFHSYYGRIKTGVFLAIERLLARFATDKIITISSQQFDEINGHFRVGRREQFEVIPLGIDLGPFAAAAGRETFRSEAGASKSSMLVGFVGRLTEIKNLPMYLKAAAVFYDEDLDDGIDVRFIIVGDGHARASLEREAADLGISDRMVFLGNRPDAENVYAGLDIVALTSLNEGTPLSLIEAMASGRPVISTVVGGVTDLLGDIMEEHEGFSIYRRGIGVRTGDAAGFARGLAHLVKNENLWADLAAEGRAFVEARYSLERLVSDIKALYRELAEGEAAEQ